MNRSLFLAMLTTAVVGACGTPTPDPATGMGMPSVTQADSNSAIDACSLLTDAEITEVLGEHKRSSESRIGESSCEWSNADHLSVSLDVGGAGTAPGGMVPVDEVMGEGEQGADGIAYHSGGYATFPVGDRACHIQVVADITGDSDRPVIDRFIALVKDRL